MYGQELTENAAKLLAMINCEAPDLDEVRQMLLRGEITPAELNAVYIVWLERNEWAYSDFRLERGHSPTEEEICSFPLGNALEILKLFTEFGIDFCAQFNQQTILRQLMFIDAPSLAPEIAAFILERDGIGSAMLIGDDTENFLESLISEIDFQLMERGMEREGFRENLDNHFALLLVALGYGCTRQNGANAVEPVEGFAPENLRNYRDYGWEQKISQSTGTYRIYEKATNRTVAFW